MLITRLSACTCVYFCKYVFVYLSVYACTCMYRYTYMYAFVRVHAHVCIPMCACVRTHVCTCINVCVCTFAHIWRACISVWMCMCMCIHANFYVTPRINICKRVYVYVCCIHACVCMYLSVVTGQTKRRRRLGERHNALTAESLIFGLTGQMPESPNPIENHWHPLGTGQKHIPQQNNNRDEVVK